MDAKEFEACYMLLYISVDVDRGVCMAPSSPEVHNDLLCLLGVKSQVVSSFPLIRPTTVLSSSNLIMVLEP